MKSSIYKKLTSGALVICLLASGFVALSYPKVARADGAAACTGGAVISIAQFVVATVKSALGAAASAPATGQNLLGNQQSASSFINNCVLKPLAQMMVVALIRNIGASVVSWVNTGFEGKPSFVTDFSGTLLNAADQAAGNFIESNTDLGFLCSPFSFQIRIALALKYSQPFNEQVRCTLTNIGNNIDNFANNNGGAGWDNWMKITTQPQNNVYGAFLIADSELAQRMAAAVDVKEKKISLGQGFLDFETCDRYETAAEVRARNVSSASAAFAQSPSTSLSINTSLTGQSTTDGLSNPLGGSTFGSDLTAPSAAATEFNSLAQTAADNTPKCLVSSTKTPGRVIADQLQSEFSTGPIQRAVAQEIDQVISATLNQLAQKAIQGATGLLGLSQKRQSNQASYIDQYRARYYGQGTTATVSDTGTQSELDAYTVGSYDDALALRNDPTNSDVQNINQFVDAAGGSQIQAQQNQVANTVNTYGGEVTERNVALGKMSSESSILNASANGNDGVKQSGQYLKGAETDPSEAGGWWEVDLGANKTIKQINIFPNTSPSAPDGGLGNFSIDVRGDSGAPTTYAGSTFTTNSGLGALTGTIGRTGRYVRITRQANETSCADDAYGDSYGSSPCVDQPHLAFAELEVIEAVDTSTATTTVPTSTTTGGGTTPTTTTNNSTATSTLSWNPALTSNVRVNNSSAMNQTINLGATKSVSGIIATVGLYDSSNRNIPFSRLFNNFDILRGPGGSLVSSQSSITPSTGNLQVGLSINQNSSFTFKITGSKYAGATPGSYSFISTVQDSTGTTLEDKTQRINFVVE